MACLRTLVDHRSLFSEGEAEELELLFGKDGIELPYRVKNESDVLAYIRSRQIYWHESSRIESNATRRQLLRIASAWYDSLLYTARANNQPSVQAGESRAVSKPQTPSDGHGDPMPPE